MVELTYCKRCDTLTERSTANECKVCKKQRDAARRAKVHECFAAGCTTWVWTRAAICKECARKRNKHDRENPVTCRRRGCSNVSGSGTLYCSGHAAALASKRRALRKKCTPAMSRTEWLEIEMLYLKAGPGEQVDHIYPIAKGGEHAPWNLQIISAEENLRKRDTVYSWALDFVRARRARYRPGEEWDPAS